MDGLGKNLYKSNMSENHRSRHIRNFNLFGENAHLPDVVHCETIEFRSRLHNWELVPHRHAHLHQILLIEEGYGSVEMDGNRTYFSASACINIPVGVVHGFSFSPDTKGWVVTIASEILDQTLRGPEGLRGHLDRPLILAGCQDLAPHMELLFSEFTAEEFARAQVLRMLCGLVMGFVARKASKAVQQPQPVTHISLHRRFQDLVDQQYRDHWPVARYADTLAITPGHLSRACRQATGASASGVIEERVIREARRLLAYTNLSVSETAYELGFIDPAYFSRVFLRASGSSPRQSRNDINKQGSEQASGTGLSPPPHDGP